MTRLIGLRCAMVLAGMMCGLTAIAAGQEPPVHSGAGPQAAGDVKALEKRKVYDENADAKQQIAAALTKAKKDNKRVLIQWGGNWCPWCIKLHNLYKSDKDIARKLLYEYEVVFVDAGRPKGKN